MRVRLRPAYTADELAKVYPAGYRHNKWADHIIRIGLTIAVTRTLEASSGADLSCGDGAILQSLPLLERHFGDYVPGWQFTGPIEDTIWQIPNVDLFVCTETLEHLDDPDTTLKAIRAKASQLILSTPVDAWSDRNPEHYWAWSRADVEAMLRDAGFSPDFYVALDFTASHPDSYCFGIWRCR